MSYLDDWPYREEQRLRLLEQQAEADKKIVRGVRIFFGICFSFIGFVILDESLGESYPVKGTVIGYSFAMGRWEGPPSMISDNFGKDAYELSLSLESGEVVSFLCFSCDRSTYQVGDSDTFLAKESWVGRRRYLRK
jgi:hypothetical protein